MRYGFICVLLVSFALPLQAEGSSLIQLETYRCPPCGCEADAIEYTEPGVCTACPMTRIESPNGFLGKAAQHVEGWFHETEQIEAAYSRFLYPAFLIGLLLGLFICLRRDRKPGEFYLGLAILILAAFPIQHHGCLLFGELGGTFHFHFIPLAHILLIGPLLFHYYRARLRGQVFARQDLVRYLPGLTGFAFYVYLFANYGQREDSYVLSETYALFAKTEQVLAVLSAGGYLLWARLKFSRQISDAKAQPTGIFAPQRLWFPLEATLAGWLLVLAADWMLFSGTTTPSTLYPLWFVLTPLFYFLSLAAFTQRAQTEEIEEVESILTTEPTSIEPDMRGMDETEIADLATRLTTLLEEQQPYLDPDLNLDALANMIDLPSKNLTVVIRHGLNTNFYDLLNRYRVEEVKRRLSDPDHAHLAILGIAMDAGFRSKSHFNQVFKQRVNQTPGQFRRQCCG